jgi:Spy/CpxP family protein refolding chaperone
LVIGFNLKDMTMKTNLKISLVAGLMLVAGLAYSQAPMAGVQCDMTGPHGYMQGQGMSHRGMGRMDTARMQARMDARHAALKATLKLTAAQEPAWTAFVDAHKPPAGMKGLPAAMPDMAKLTTPERLDKMKELRTQHMGEMTAAMDKRGEATKAFYAVLTPEQQKVFDAQAMQGRGSHKGMPGGKGMMQPKM